MKAAVKAGRTPRNADEHRISIRVVEYMVKGRGETQTIRLITTLLDFQQPRAESLAALYQQRWEQELVFDEVKTHQMSPHWILRSRTPDLVKQEIWALLITHYATHVFITEAADELGADSDRYSFTKAINIIRSQVLNQAAFPPQPLTPPTAKPSATSKQATLPKRRQRSCPRVVRRITIRNTNVKHAHHKIIKYDAAPEIFVFNRPTA